MTTKPYHLMTPAERTALTIANNRATEARIAEQAARRAEAHKKAAVPTRLRDVTVFLNERGKADIGSSSQALTFPIIADSIERLGVRGFVAHKDIALDIMNDAEINWLLDAFCTKENDFSDVKRYNHASNMVAWFSQKWTVTWEKEGHVYLDRFERSTKKKNSGETYSYRVRA